NIFEKNTNALFTSSDRKYNVSFQYAWSAIDDITIDLPARYSVETAEGSGPIKDTSGFLLEEATMGFAPDSRTPKYIRELNAGGSQLVFPRRAYGKVKELFELVHSADTQSIMLKKELR